MPSALGWDSDEAFICDAFAFDATIFEASSAMGGPLLGRPGLPDGFIGSEEGLIPGGKICAWLNAARRAAFSTLS